MTQLPFAPWEKTKLMSRKNSTILLQSLVAQALPCYSRVRAIYASATFERNETITKAVENGTSRAPFQPNRRYNLRPDFYPAFNIAPKSPKASMQHDTLPEWSKGVDSSSTSASCVGSNPTGVIFLLTSLRTSLTEACERTKIKGMH